MATFVSTVKFTEQGVRGVQDTTKRAAAVRSLAKKFGIKVRDIYWTLGENDGLLIMDAPDEESATALMLHIGSQGNVKTNTVRAYNAAEMDKILAKTNV
jgi:uncharacterized protein with GYD domain